MKSVYDVIRRPVITEKSTALKEVEKQVVFEVDKRANKFEIREAVQTLFGVKVASVNTVIMAGKPKRFGRLMGRRAKWRKAVITLKPGEELDFYESVNEDGAEV